MRSTPLPELDINNFTEVVTISDDTWNVVNKSQICRTYYTKTDPHHEIGYIDYRLYTGQIGRFYIYDKGVYGLEEDYSERGLGKQILTRATNDIRDYGTVRLQLFGL